MKKIKMSLLGAASGAVNGFFGTGGGMLLVPILKKMGLTQKAAQATALAVMLPITALSAVFYAVSDPQILMMSLYFLPSAIIGSVVGAKLLKLAKNRSLKIAFSLLIIAAGIKIFLK